MEDVRMAVQMGYQVIEIYEVYEYQITHYDPQNKDGASVDYIYTFLKLKAEASGYPD
jgi:hypothetical protein